MATTNVGRFMTENGISTLTELRRQSIADPAWFWNATVQFLGIRFAEPYTDVLEVSRGIEWAT